MNLIGEAFVDVRAYKTADELQYSVFGNKYVLLQEKHLDDVDSGAASPKRVWLLNSEKLNAFLTARALSIIENSKDVPETLFKRFFAKVSGVTAQNILARLMKEGLIHEEGMLDKNRLSLTLRPRAKWKFLRLLGS
jgi:hypothetical protein